MEDEIVVAGRRAVDVDVACAVQRVQLTMVVDEVLLFAVVACELPRQLCRRRVGLAIQDGLLTLQNDRIPRSN